MYLIQKGDTFLWKLERIVKNSPSCGYILEIPPQVDIFAETKRKTKRKLKPTKKMNI